MYLSLYLKEHRNEYYRLLNDVRTNGDWESWIAFFLEGVQHTATEAVETARQLVDVFRHDENRLMDLGRKRFSAERVLRLAQKRPLLSIDATSKITGMSYPTASAAIQLLVQKGILQETTGMKRNRVFAYKEYLAKLQVGGDPL